MYEDFSDEELIKNIKQKDIKILEILLERYNKYIDTMIKSYDRFGSDKEELRQEAVIGLYKAIRGFNGNQNILFKTYATKCIKNELNTYLRTKQRKKNIILEEAISLNNIINDSQDVDFIENIPDSDINNPLNKIIEEEKNNEFKNSVKNILSNFEYEVFKEYINGINYIDIATKLNASPKSVDNAIQRIKAKISSILNN